MKTLIASVFALSLLGATAANAEVGVGVHVGGVGAGVHMGTDDHHDRGRHRRCHTWGWRNHHHDRYCRHWGW